MFFGLFFGLRRAGVPVSLREHLTLLQAMQAGLALFDIDDFYLLARATLIKQERHLDRFDQVFGEVFRGLEREPGAPEIEVLDLQEWLKAATERILSPEERALLQSLGGWEALMQTLRDRLAEQDKRHEGGAKWIGTKGVSPFGAMGENPEGVRMRQPTGRHGHAVKVWDARHFRDYDDRGDLSPRTMKLALRRLRAWARDGVAQELDLDHTLRRTAHNGYLDVQTRPERRNAVKILLLLDVGGSMDPHVELVQSLFSAARGAFQHLDVYYFHNCVYEGVWRDNRRRWQQQTPTAEVLRRHPADTRVIFVGDAKMSPYELTIAGGASEHWNAEPGALWLARVIEKFPHAAWINPVVQNHWGFSPSIGMVHDILGGRMYPMTLPGLDQAMRGLMRRG